MRNNKKLILIVVGVAVAVMAVTFGAVAALEIVSARHNPIIKDSGIAACEGMATKDKQKNNKPIEKMTEQEYLELRETFGSSRYDDLREAGTKFIDVIWQTRNLEGFEGFAFINALTDAYTEMAGACANHGIVLPPLEPEPTTTN